jgi:hypothetical protein
MWYRRPGSWNLKSARSRVGRRFPRRYWSGGETFQHIGLVLAPFFYLGIYLLILQVAKAATRTTIPLRTLALALSLTILPIAFVYNLAHYFTLILVRTPVLLLVLMMAYTILGLSVISLPFALTGRG